MTKHLRRDQQESVLKRICATCGALIMDIWRWLRLSRKCVRGQTIVITGGASGLGKRLAELFSAPESLGARVAIIDNNKEGADTVVKDVRKETNGLATIKAWNCDISDPKAVRDCAEEIRREFGKVDIVVCNAAILHFAHCLELNDNQIQTALSVNVLGTINTIRAFLGPMVSENHGHIVTVASIASYFGETFGMAYCPTKFAVRGLMECLRMELYDRCLDGVACDRIYAFLAQHFSHDQWEAPIPCDQTDSSEGTIPFLNTHNEFPPSLIVNEKIAPLEPVILSAASAASDTASNAQEKNVNQDTSGNENKGTTGETATEWEYIAPNQLLLQHRIGRTTKNSNENGTINGFKNLNRQLYLPPLPINMFGSRERFRLAHPFWYVLIPPALVFTFLTYLNPELVHWKLLCWLGDFAFYLGTEHSLLMLLINIAAWMAHLGEAIYAIWICDEIHLTHVCSLKWFAQTLLLGFPSLWILLSHRRENFHPKMIRN